MIFCSILIIIVVIVKKFDFIELAKIKMYSCSNLIFHQIFVDAITVRLSNYYLRPYQLFKNCNLIRILTYSRDLSQIINYSIMHFMKHGRNSNSCYQKYHGFLIIIIVKKYHKNIRCLSIFDMLYQNQWLVLLKQEHLLAIILIMIISNHFQNIQNSNLIAFILILIIFL